MDSTDTTRLGEARCELCDVLLDERMSKVPLLVLANKQDLRSALPSSMIVDQMGLNRIRDRDWKIAECSVISNIGIFVSSLFFIPCLKLLNLNYFVATEKQRVDL